MNTEYNAAITHAQAEHGERFSPAAMEAARQFISISTDRESRLTARPESDSAPLARRPDGDRHSC